MTTVLFEELKSVALEQNIVVEERISLKTIRLNLIKALSPAGTLILKVKDESGTIIEGTLTSAQIETQASEITALNYFHGFIDFGLEDFVLNPGNYTVELSSSGYTYSDSSYYGWVKEFENRTNRLSSAVVNVSDSPLSFQAWEYKK